MSKNNSAYNKPSRGISLILRELRFHKRMVKNNRENDAFVLSIPKSGRTWHRLMVGFYLSRLANCEPQRAFDAEFLCSRTGIKRFKYSHNYSGFSVKLPLSSRVMASPVEWRGKDVLILVRKIPDCLRSNYFHAKFRDNGFIGSFSDFIRQENTGIDKMLLTFNSWSRNRYLAKSFFVLSYEQMHENPALVLEKSLEVFGLSKLNQTWIEEAVSFASFENMRKYEETNYFNNQALQSKSNDLRARKVRNGKIENDFLNAEDLRYIEDRVKSIGNPFADMM